MCARARAYAQVAVLMGRRAPGAKTDILVIEGGGACLGCLALCLRLLLLSSGPMIPTVFAVVLRLSVYRHRICDI